MTEAQHQDRGALRLATCHPDKRAVAKTGKYAGLCAACYHKARRGDQAASAVQAVEAARALVGAGAPLDAPAPPGAFPDRSSALTLQEALAVAEADLIRALPEATIALRRALATDPLDGVALRAAEALLRHYPIPTEDGTRRLFESPTRPVAGSQPAQVVIGLSIVPASAPGENPKTIVGKVVGTVPASHVGAHPKE